MPLQPEPKKKVLPADTVFRMCANHMLKQKVKSCTAADFTLYHCDDGRKCPVGIFMSPEHADAVEGLPVSDDAVIWSLQIAAPPRVLKVLEAFQELHDNVLPKYWPGRIHSLGRKFKVEQRR